MAGIKIRRGLLSALRDHFCGIRLSRYPSRSELLPLNIVLRLPRPAVIDLPPNFYALVVDLPTGFGFPHVRTRFQLARNYVSSESTDTNNVPDRDLFLLTAR